MKVPTGTQVFDSFDPSARAGDTVVFKPNLSLKDHKGELLTFTAPDGGHVPNGVHVKIEGPQLKIEPADMAGMYPAPGSDDSPDDYLAHIAFNRRTFPWERFGPG